MRSLALLLSLAGVVAVTAQPSSLLLDDFARGDGVSAAGTRWLGFTDRVMGGLSDQFVSLEAIDGRRALRLVGRVRLENNGGFIQVALPLAGAGASFDASRFAGVRLHVRGNGERYAVHLRTTTARLPWQYYEASFDAGAQWTIVDLPFDSFSPESIARPLDPSRLTRLGVVAAKRAFDADIAVARIEFYANHR